MYFLLRSEAQSNTCNFKNLSPKVGNILVFSMLKLTDFVNKQKNAEFSNFFPFWKYYLSGTLFYSTTTKIKTIFTTHLLNGL